MLCRRRRRSPLPALASDGYHLSPMPAPRSLVLLLTVVLGAAPAPARAESALRLPPPAVFGSIPSATFDDAGKKLGEARLDVLRLASGNVYLLASGSITGAEAMVLSTELAPTADGAALHPLWQMSHAYDKAGNSLGVMFIDHEKEEAFCAHEDGNPAPPDRLPVPQPDRVAHVPLNLLFLPLAKGEASEIKFEFLLCALGPRFVDAKATVARRIPPQEGKHPLVEVRYELDLNPVLAAVARPFLPRFAFWFDPLARDPWVAHRMPLASKGPAVLIVRSGVLPAALGVTP